MCGDGNDHWYNDGGHTKLHAWHFHTPNPGTDLGEELNPHFDSVEGLKLEAVYERDPEGLDCVLLMSCGTFDLEVGEEVNFSFCVIYGEDRSDLLRNAEFAQIMYSTLTQQYEQNHIV